MTGFRNWIYKMTNLQPDMQRFKFSGLVNGSKKINREGIGKFTKVKHWLTNYDCGKRWREFGVWSRRGAEMCFTTKPAKGCRIFPHLCHENRNWMTSDKLNMFVVQKPEASMATRVAVVKERCAWNVYYFLPNGHQLVVFPNNDKNPAVWCSRPAASRAEITWDLFSQFCFLQVKNESSVNNMQVMLVPTRSLSAMIDR